VVMVSILLGVAALLSKIDPVQPTGHMTIR
jgi:hypothetical protein